MIATLSGEVSEKLTNTIIIDVHGVGYEIFVTTEDYSRFVLNKQIKAFIYEHIREQSHDLFGFVTRDTKNLFEKLLNVTGIGPKMALNMLSIGTADEVRRAIASGDVKFIQQANGVGKRVAERVVVELKDKVGLIGVDLESTGLLQSEASVLRDEAAEALISLGYSAQDAAKALQDIDPSLSTEARIKVALRGGK
jgi:Holliday junction DNA helicase RuvA